MAHGPHGDTLDLDLRLANRQERTQFFVARALRSQRLPKPLRQSQPRGVYVPQPPVDSRGAVVKMWTTKATTTVAHSRYLQRGKGIDGADAPLFGPDAHPIDRQAFIARAQDDSHQFRLILSLVPPVCFDWMDFIHTYMHQVSQDVRSALDFTAVIHYDRQFIHAHVLWRAQTDDGRPLYLTKDYYFHGLRFRAQALATSWLGRLSPAQVTREQQTLPLVAADILDARPRQPRVLSPQLVTARVTETAAQVERFKTHVQRVQQRHMERQATQHGRPD